jgi:membrane protein DedA with SNARE-associated domain/membrane-associated phospholipid phosphatase
MSWMSINRKWVGRLALAAVAIVAFVFLWPVIQDIDLEALIEDLSESLGAWTYLLVGALAFLETGAFVGLVAPGEFTVILGGAVASQGDVSLPVILAITWFSAFLGDSMSFLLGAKLGRGFLVRHGARFQITPERLKRVENYFDRHGGKTILIGRFIGLVRALAPFIAGSSRMRYSAFAPYSVLGTGLWATAFILVGYFFGRNLNTVTEIVSRGVFAFGVAVGVVVAVVLAWRFLRERANRERVVAEMEKRGALRPLLALGRRVRPQVAFLGRRLTPGGQLGLEFTTLWAALAVALFVLIAFWSVVAGDPGPTPGDDRALDVARDLQTGWLNDLAEGVTELGAGAVTIPLAIVAAIALAVLRRWAEFWVLVVGFTLIVLIGPEIKGWTDRPRPPDPVISASGTAYPSGHAAQATIYTWLAITLAFRVVPGITRRSLVIAAGIALTALIGLSRVYLGVHWLSDVSGGWALGVSCFSAVAIVALVITHIRDNPPRHERADQLRPGAGAGAGH